MGLIKVIIKYDKSIIPACDVSTMEQLKRLVAETCSVDGIGGYKIGFELVIPFGMKAVVDEIRQLTDIPIIYDHQKAATDVPFTGEKFCKACKGADALIFFPQAGPETQKAWILAAKESGFGVIVGGEMTHPAFLESDNGYLMDNTPERIYKLAAELGVIDFVVPGNKPEKIKNYKQLLESLGINPVFYSPGLISQGGDITESANAAGNNWHAIVGRALYNAENITESAKRLVASLK